MDGTLTQIWPPDITVQAGAELLEKSSSSCVLCTLLERHSLEFKFL